MEVQALIDDFKVDTEQRLNFKGSALVRFEYLKWDEYFGRHEAKPDTKSRRVKRLVDIFNNAGCHRLATKNHIPATIHQHQLDVALKEAQQNGTLDADSLLTNYTTSGKYPELNIPDGIQCLDGFHRIEAGKEYLQETGRWWIIDLYLSDISDELKISLIEDYDNSERPSDGEIYRKIRQYRDLPAKAINKIAPATCVMFEMRWWSFLPKSRKDKLRRLLGSSEQSRRLAAGFNALSSIPALFDAGMMVTTLNKVMDTKCVEEIEHYLGHIFSTWVGFLDNVDNGRQRLDIATVRAIEFRAPGASSYDACHLEVLIRNGIIFGGFTPSERSIIWNNIVKFKGIIPSLSKFFQDIHLLQACVSCIRWLINVPTGKTVFEELMKAYKSSLNTQLVQDSETTCWVTKGNRMHCVRVGYLGLIVHSMHNYKKMPTAPVRNNLKEIPRAKADAGLVQRSASIAKQLGFSTPEIEKLKGESEPLKVVDSKTSSPLMVTTGSGVSLKRRCGLPHMDTFEADKKYLYLQNLCEEVNVTGEGITSFFALKSWFSAFFGQWDKFAIGPVITNPLQDQQSNKYSVSIEHQQHQCNATDADIEMTQIGVDISNSEAKTLFVPVGQDTEDKRDVCIGFVEHNGDAGTMTKPLQKTLKATKYLTVKYGDPDSLVAREVVEYSKRGRRVCDRNAKYISAAECYGVAIKKENENTLFVTHDIGQEDVTMEDAKDSQLHSLHFLPRLEDHNRYTRPRRNPLLPPATYSTPLYVPRKLEEMEIVLGDKVDFLLGDKVDVAQDDKVDAEDDKVDGTQGDKVDVALGDTVDAAEESDTVLSKEKANAINTHIYAKDMTVIHLKKMVSKSFNKQTRKEEIEWKDYPPIEVPTNNPKGYVILQMRNIFYTARLRPCNRDLRILTDRDCYAAAQDDKDHTLYLIPVNDNLDTTRKLVEADSDRHRDKIGKSHSNKIIGLSFDRDEPNTIKKGPKQMRTTDDGSIPGKVDPIMRPKIMSLKTEL